MGADILSHPEAGLEDGVQLGLEALSLAEGGMRDGLASHAAPNAAVGATPPYPCRTEVPYLRDLGRAKVG